MKKIISILILAAVLLPLAASVTNGTAGLRTASTEHFDIIYQPSSIETAALLYENCESVYDSLVEFFGEDPKLHIPVTVTGEYKVLNAYYTSYPANRIVIFDTVLESGSLSVFPQTVLYIFRHELTHAFQFNFRGPFIDALSKVFSDGISLSPLLYMTKSLSEGGAVLSESVTGYGRANDSYSMQIVKQAKIEGLFPTYLEISGVRDTYPGSLLYYNFAACFLQYLAETYGYENIASLWVRMGRPGFFESLGHMFRERTGRPIEQAWIDFYDSIEVPDSVLQAQATEVVDPGVFHSPVLSEDGDIYIYETFTSSVLRLTEDGAETVLGLPTSGTGLSVSADGTRLLIPYISESSASVRLYDISGGARLLADLRPADEGAVYRGGCFAELDGAQCLALVSSRGQRNTIVLVDPDTLEPIPDKAVELGFDVVASSLTALDDGRLAFILRHGALDRLAVLDLRTMEIRAMRNPDRIRFMSLSKGTDGKSGVLGFVWYPDNAKSANLGRYGEIRISDLTYEGCTMALSAADVSGSMRECIRKGETILFDAYLYSGRLLSEISVSELELVSTAFLEAEPFDSTMAPGVDTEGISTASTDYRAIRYFKDGTLIPMLAFEFSGNSTDFMIGANWTTMDPTETFEHVLDLSAGKAFVSASYSLFRESHPLSGVHLSASLGSLSLLLGAGVDVRLLDLELRDYNEVLSVVDNYRFSFEREFESGEARLVHDNLLKVVYARARSTGPGLYEVFRFQASAKLNNLDPELEVSLSLPRLLWWRCTGPTVTNIPFKVSLSGFYSVNDRSFTFGHRLGLKLFSREIQRDLRFLNLYCKRFSVDAKYSATENLGLDGSFIFGQRLSVGASLVLTPVIGAALSSLDLELDVALETDFRNWTTLTALDGLILIVSFGFAG